MVVRGRPAAFATSLALATFGFAPSLGAEPGWLVIEGPCRANALEMARRVDAALIGSRPVGVRARISIEAKERGYRVTLHARRRERELGVKQLVAPSCDEAVDAAVLVLAIALTEPEERVKGAQPESQAPSGAPAPASPVELGFGPPASPLDLEEPVHSEEGSSSVHARRLGMLFGIEIGALPRPTPYLGASFVLPVQAWEVRSVLRYGLPTEEEFVETGSYQHERSDFGAFDLALCRSVGAAWRFSLCFGGEFSVVRLERTRREGEVEVDTDEGRARVAGVATGRLTGRAGRLHPELEFSTAAVSLGPGAAPALSLRVGAGIAVQF